MASLIPTRLPGLSLVEPKVYDDERGFFVETFRASEWARLGITGTFPQDNHSRSRGGSIRGLHFTVGDGQAKLIRVARGAVFDVVVDLRRSSPTYAEHEAFELDDRRHRQLFVPVGFAHGFAVLSEVADVCYRVSAEYDPSLERGVLWNDPALQIAWPVTDPVLSARDRANPTLRDVELSLPEW